MSESSPYNLRSKFRPDLNDSSEEETSSTHEEIRSTNDDVHISTDQNSDDLVEDLDKSTKIREAEKLDKTSEQKSEAVINRKISEKSDSTELEILKENPDVRPKNKNIPEKEKS